MASPQVAQAKTAGSALDQIDAFLSQVSADYQKQAAESQKDKPENTPSEQSKPKSGDVSTSQRGLGKEQTADAEDSGSTVAKVSPNSDDGGPSSKQPGDGKADQPQLWAPGESSGNAQAQRHQETVQEKTARTIRLGNAILTKLAEAEAKKPAAPSVAATVTLKGEKVGVDKKEKKGAGAEKQAADTFLEKCAAVAAERANQYYQSFLAGMVKRAQDEAELANVDWEKLGVSKEALDAVGGTSGLLDKIAAEDPVAIMEGMGAPPPEAGGAMPPMGGAELGGAPGGAPAGGGQDMGAVADALAEAGVEPQDIDQAAQALNELFQSGVSPEEAAQAVSELVAEQGGGAGGAPGAGGPAEAAPEMGGAPAEMAGGAPAELSEPPAEAAPEAPAEESAEAPEEEKEKSEGESDKEGAQKTAAEKQAAYRMQVIKNHLRGNLK